MRFFIMTLFVVQFGTLCAQIDSVSAVKEIKSFQDELTEEYKEKKTSPLEPKDLRRFKKHSYFPINLKYRVNAKYVKVESPVVFKMKTTTDRLPEYAKFAEVTFQIDGVNYKLNLYQSMSLKQKPGYEDYLFLPFTDLTNGKETYAGGRFLDLRIPPGDSIIIDFNKAYNPYCAYSPKYSCPVTPAENELNAEIRAGVMLEKKNKK